MLTQENTIDVTIVTVTQDEGIQVTKSHSIDMLLFRETMDIPINKRKGNMTRLLEEEILVRHKKCGLLRKGPFAGHRL